jgi:hypothetical protein
MYPGDPLVRFHLRRLEAGETGVVLDLAARDALGVASPVDLVKGG